MNTRKAAFYILVFCAISGVAILFLEAYKSKDWTTLAVRSFFALIFFGFIRFLRTR
jgi:hypothetical protein